ncbi:hypothetical protein Taro_045871, partial [Colocasia esculenta]|nr:hypothetical protein [Colocasia esculenta]
LSSRRSSTETPCEEIGALRHKRSALFLPVRISWVGFLRASQGGRFQAEAFHEPVALFDDFFFQFFERDEDVMLHLDGAEEYLYVSRIAVLKSYKYGN